MKIEVRPSGQKRVIIIDALNLFVRNYVVNPTMDSKGIPIGGSVGFLKSLQKLIRKTRPDEVIISWDGIGGSQRKKAQNKDYKAGRNPLRFNRRMIELDPKQQKQNRIYQQIRLFEYLNELPVFQISIDAVEADDVIAYMSKHRNCQERQKLTISSDKDFFQLCDNTTVVYRPIQDTLETDGTLVHTYGIHPNNFALARAIAGDPSDNLKGVPRVGLKSIAKNFSFLSESKQYDMDDLASICEEQKKPKAIHRNLLEHRKTVDQNYDLMQLYDPNISLIHRQSIDFQIKNYESESNKLNFRKLLFSDGQGSLNFDDLWLHLKNVTR